MLIYYAHSMLIYNTEKEREEIDLIKLNEGHTYGNYDVTIINPNGWIYDNGNGKDVMEQCFVFIKQSDMTVFSTLKDGVIGKGVYSEIEKALYYDKSVFHLRQDGDMRRFLEKDFDKIELVNEGKDWKKYAKVKL